MKNPSSPFEVIQDYAAITIPLVIEEERPIISPVVCPTDPNEVLD